MACDLAARGLRGAGLRVLRDNLGARWFYEALGGFLAARWPPKGSRPSVPIDIDEPTSRSDLIGLRSIPAAPHATLVQTPGGRHRISSWAERVLPALERGLDRRCSR